MSACAWISGKESVGVACTVVSCVCARSVHVEVGAGGHVNG